MLKILYRELQLLEIKHNIRTKTREDIDEQQREYFLQQQIKNIKEELGNGDTYPERKELTERQKVKNGRKKYQKHSIKKLINLTY